MHGQNHFKFILTYLLTNILTYSMEQIPSWKANRFSASHEIPCILCNSKVHLHSQVPATSPCPEPARSSIKKFLVLHWTVSLTFCTVLSPFHCIQPHISCYSTQKQFIWICIPNLLHIFCDGGWQIGYKRHGAWFMATAPGCSNRVLLKIILMDWKA